MYLPIVLVRDFGAAGWWAFAVPNVIGAAAMGWVLTAGREGKSPDRSRVITRDHSLACVVFSMVTIAFHAFFLPWKFGWPGMIAIAPALVLALSVKKDVDACVAALLTWLVSAGALVYLASRGDLAPMNFVQFHGDGWSALSLAAPCVFGFLLCPYLDLTFHRARQSLTTNAQARLAFTLGFGVLFLLMIIATPLYGSLLASLASTTLYAAVALIVHVSMQAALTVALHARAIQTSHRSISMTALAIAIGFAAYGGLLGLEKFGFTHYAGLQTGEVIYRLFMSFYGLVAPAYVLLVMTRGTPLRTNLIVCLVAILVALPFYWVGFIERQMVWVVPGVLVVVLARFFSRPTGGLQNDGISIQDGTIKI